MRRGQSDEEGKVDRGVIRGRRSGEKKENVRGKKERRGEGIGKWSRREEKGSNLVKGVESDKEERTEEG